uniref:Uncharacterized protein n=1 Tax=Knipowitschia caucasica TaxID=637954 RepID=A0AAV2IS65_KNICA
MARIPALHLSRCVLLVSGLVLALCPVACTAEEHGSDAGGDGETPCELKTVTVSTLPVLRENEFSFTGGGGAGAGGGAGGGGGGGGGAGGSSGGGTGATAGGESRLLLFVRTDIPGRVLVVDDLENTALPYFTLVKHRLTSSRQNIIILVAVQRQQEQTLPWFHSDAGFLSLNNGDKR